MVKKIILVVLTILVLVYTYKHYTVDNKVESTQQTEFIPETMDLEMQMEEECLE